MAREGGDVRLVCPGLVGGLAGRKDSKFVPRVCSSSAVDAGASPRVPFGFQARIATKSDGTVTPFAVQIAYAQGGLTIINA